MSPEAIRSKIDNAIKKYPILATYTRLGTKERVKRFPVRAVRDAVLRRIEAKLVGIGLISRDVKFKTFWDDKLLFARAACFEPRMYDMIAGEELFLTKFIADRTNPGDIFIDGGAHVGLYTSLAAALVGETGLVYAFEQTPRTMAALQKNIGARANVHFETNALGKEIKKVTFHDFGEGHDVGNTLLNPKFIPHGDELARGGTDIEVDLTTLDAFCAMNSVKPNFIKLDLEGAEIDALRGASETLRTHHPIVTSEVWSGRGFLRELISFMRQFSYVPYELTASGAEPIKFDMEKFDSPAPDAVFDQKNIAFIAS